MQRLNRRQFLLTSAAAGGALALAACGGGGSAAGNSTGAGGSARSGGSPRWGMTPEQESAWQQIEAAANKEGSVTYYAQGIITPSQVPMFMEAFKKSYPGITVDLVNGTPSDVQTRISTEQDAKTYVGDIADISIRSGLLEAQRGYTQKFTPPAAVDSTTKYTTKVVYGDGDVATDHMTWFPLWVNTNLVKPQDEPKTHLDVVDPKWKGKIMWYTPWAEGGGWVEYYYSKKLYGMDWVNRMLALQPTFASSTPELLTPLARGECAVVLGSTGAGIAVQMYQNHQPIKAIWLDDFVQGVPTGHVLLKNAPHPNAAKVLLNWWVDEPGQHFQGEVLGQFPVRADVPVRDDWQKGVDHPKEHIVNADIPDSDSAQAQKEAASYFKK
ncbi:MAG: extracellular solute-binding protein [Chloroflexi bacterium]|nr:extracellular solute-binding protein [Chloroflexota bacterium]